MQKTNCLLEFSSNFLGIENIGLLRIELKVLYRRKGNETGNLWGYEMIGDWSQPEGWTRMNLATGKPWGLVPTRGLDQDEPGNRYTMGTGPNQRAGPG